MLVVVACVLFVLWLLAVLAFRVTKGIIHLVLIIAIIAIIVHFVRGGGERAALLARHDILLELAVRHCERGQR